MPSSGPLSPEHRALSVGAVLIISVVAFEILGVATALPEVARDLGGLGAYGWSFTAALLASVAGVVAAGQLADGPGPVRPFLGGLAAFVAGCAVAAAAPSWPVFLVGRALLGFGVGSVVAVVYVAVARSYPERLYGQMMALLSTAWVVPSLAGPALAGVVAERFGWRWVFAMLLPLVPVAAFLAVPALRTLERGDRPRAEGPNRLPAALVLIAGLAGALGGLELASVPAQVAAVAVGAAVALPALTRLLPAGTLRVARGLPSGVAARGLLAVAYLGCEAFLPLGLVRLRDLSLPEAGVVLSAGSLSWSLGAAVQGRLDRLDLGRGRGRRVVGGMAVLLLGLAATAAALSAADAPVAAVAAGWVLAGLGIGVAYPSVSALVLSQAPSGAEGSASSALQLSETIGVAVFTGVGGALVAFGLTHGWTALTAIALIFAAGVAAALAGVVAGRRIVPA